MFQGAFTLLQEENDKRERTERLVQPDLESEIGCISYQVVQETVNVITRKLGAPPEKTRQIFGLHFDASLADQPNPEALSEEIRRSEFSTGDSPLTVPIYIHETPH